MTAAAGSGEVRATTNGHHGRAVELGSSRSPDEADGTGRVAGAGPAPPTGSAAAPRRGVARRQARLAAVRGTAEVPAALVSGSVGRAAGPGVSPALRLSAAGPAARAASGSAAATPASGALAPASGSGAAAPTSGSGAATPASGSG